MSADLPTLRARVEAAQALAANATPGPWIVHQRRNTAGWGTCVGPGHRMIARMTGGRGSAVTQRDKDAALLAAAPDLVTLATDLLAEVDRLDRDLTAIRSALGNGADEAAWPPGMTLAGAVGRLRGEHHGLRDVLQWVNDQCPGKCSAVCDSALRAGHEGPHAEALGASNDGVNHG